jgi:AcrR family transcriptional regulator
MKRRKKGLSYHHGDLAEAILSVSEKLILQKGVEAFSLREASRAIGVDPSAFYKHYKDKSEILIALARNGFSELSSLMDSELKEKANLNSQEKILALAIAYFKFASTKPALFGVMFKSVGMDSRDTLLAGSYRNNTGPYDLLLSIVKDWLTEKKVTRDVNLTAIELWAAIHGMTGLILDGTIRKDLMSVSPSFLIANLVETILNGLDKK